jgi:SAM-dependent methyltransferase
LSTDLINGGYKFDDRTSVWIRSGYGGIAYNDGDEFENRIAALMDSCKDLSVLSDELCLHCTDWPSTYHLSRSRANVLRPFERRLSGSTLEIGAGCGAITRYLGECGGSVLALEGSPRRAAIARARTRDLNNVVVVSDTFNDFHYPKKFDAVTLIGVLEYANMFSSEENPALSMLLRAQSFLKPNGILLIAIENQLGLKYFAGAPEDHVGIPMYGLEGRYLPGQPKTYGRKTLSQLLAEAGFKSTEFLASFPDYKLPVSIVTEKGFSCASFDAAGLASQSVSKDPQKQVQALFSMERTWPTIADNGLALELANSFIVVASSSAEPILARTPALAWHFSTERRAPFSKVTEFLEHEPGNIEVRYRHLDLIAGRSGKGMLLRQDLRAHATYRRGNSLLDRLISIITSDRWSIEDVCLVLTRWLNFLSTLNNLKNQGIDLSDPYQEFPPEFLDYTVQNILEDSNGLYVIDEEWVAARDLEVGYLVFRSLLIMANSFPRSKTVQHWTGVSYFHLCHSVFIEMGWKISDDDLDRYMTMEAAFQSDVSGLDVSKENIEEYLENFSQYVFSDHNQNQPLNRY